MQVVIQYKNSEKVIFKAQEFDLDLSTATRGQTSELNKLVRFTYTNNSGEESPIFLNLHEVAGIVVTPN